MAHEQKIAEVFKAVGLPRVTYVKRDNGKLEKQLGDALNERGQLCLVTGPSKTGKTTLYREVLAERGEVPLVVRCDRTKTVDIIWKQALESVDFDRVESRTRARAVKVGGEGEAAGKLGRSWLAEGTARRRYNGIFSISENVLFHRLRALGVIPETPARGTNKRVVDGSRKAGVVVRAAPEIFCVPWPRHGLA